MSKKKKRQRISVLFLLFSALLLSACNLPRSSPTPSGIDLISTYAAQTVQAQMTEISRPPATAPPSTPSSVVTSTPQVTNQPGVPTATGIISTAVPGCNVAKFVKDINVPDNTAFDPGDRFVKTWRLENAGSCTWTPGYSLFFFNGDQMGAPDMVNLTRNVLPGETTDISVSMTAPQLAGAYKGEWKLRSDKNEAFGIGDSAKPIWVQVLVVTETGMDFISQASSALWKSGGVNQPTTTLGFGGDINDPNGVARIVEGQTLENGRPSGKVLLTYPKHTNDGWTSGTYQPYLIQQGNHLEARLGFLTNQDGTCGVGKVTFQIRYKEGDSVTTLGEWQKICDGSLLPIDLDLSRLAGKTVQFILSVKAEGSFQDDWAVWNSPQITK